MKKLLHLLLAGGLILISLIGCRQAGEGPRAWMDEPLDESVFPMQRITLQAHASDADGVTNIIFQVGDEIIRAISTGGGRMEKAIIEWMPPGAGKYTLLALAVDGSGNRGMPAASTITITGQTADALPAAPFAVEEEPEEEIQEESEEEEEDQIQVSEDLPPSALPWQDINCRGGPSTSYEIITYLRKDIPAEITGRLPDSSWLVVLHPESGASCWVSAGIVDVSGDLGSVSIAQAPPLPEQPPAEEPEGEEPPGPPPEEDTSPPVITAVSVSPQTIYQSGCSGEAQTLILTVEAIDIGGISSVEAAWAVSGEIGQSVMNYVGANRYQVTIGPFSKTGTLNIYGSVIDGAANWTPFNITAEVTCCIC